MTEDEALAISIQLVATEAPRIRTPNNMDIHVILRERSDRRI
jgi:hypothetical protein